MPSTVLSREARLHLVVALRAWRDRQFQCHHESKSSSSSLSSSSSPSHHSSISGKDPIDANQDVSSTRNSRDHSITTASPDHPLNGTFRVTEADNSSVFQTSHLSLLIPHVVESGNAPESLSNHSTINNTVVETLIPGSTSVAPQESNVTITTTTTTVNSPSNPTKEIKTIPSIIGHLPLSGRTRWPRTRNDIENDLVLMEEQLDVDFRRHIRDEHQAEAIASELARLADDFDLLSMASGLRWLWMDLNKVLAVSIHVLENTSPAETAGTDANMNDHRIFCLDPSSASTASTVTNINTGTSVNPSCPHGLRFNEMESTHFHNVLDAYRRTIVSQCTNVTMITCSVKGSTCTNAYPSTSADHYVLPRLQRMTPWPIRRFIVESVDFNGVDALVSATLIPVSSMSSTSTSTSTPSAKCDNQLAADRLTNVNLNLDISTIAGMNGANSEHAIPSLLENTHRFASSGLLPMECSSRVSESTNYESNWQPGYRPERRATTMLQFARQ
ncbi:hypothetical protein BDF22DRAFT_740003 [Syncephalis plumigaleata]|nr:hypothetical protein BDF22DRAFT_740003 [Syncephalis plumigaleata]